MSKRYWFGVGAALAVVLAAGGVLSGDLTPPGPPGPSMRTLQEIYDEVKSIDAKIDAIGVAAPVPKTGQTKTEATGDDGYLQRGVAWPDPRFTDHDDGTVTDNLTDLMWTKNANLPGGSRDWFAALTYSDAMNSGGGTYGYTDWRLPNLRELQSLIDYSRAYPPLPAGHPFSGVHDDTYWSSTRLSDMVGTPFLLAWRVHMGNGNLNQGITWSDLSYVWPVRGGP